MNVRLWVGSLVCVLGMGGVQAQVIERMSPRQLVVTGDLASPESGAVLVACLDEPSRCRDDNGEWQYPVQLWLRFLSLVGHPDGARLLESMRRSGGSDRGFALAEARQGVHQGHPEVLAALARDNQYRRQPDLVLLARAAHPDAAARAMVLLGDAEPRRACLGAEAAMPMVLHGDAVSAALAGKLLARLEGAGGTSLECLLDALSPETVVALPALKSAVAAAFLRLLADPQPTVRMRTLGRLETWLPVLPDVALEQAVGALALAERRQDPQDRPGALHLAALHRLLPDDITGGPRAERPRRPATCCTPGLHELLRSHPSGSPGWSLALPLLTLAETWDWVAEWEKPDWTSPKAGLLRAQPGFDLCRACRLREQEMLESPPAEAAAETTRRQWSPVARLILLGQGRLAADSGAHAALWQEAFADPSDWHRAAADHLARRACGIPAEPADLADFMRPADAALMPAMQECRNRLAGTVPGNGSAGR